MSSHPLITELQKLRESSKHAVADGNSYSLDEFREYLHIERHVENNLKNLILEKSTSETSLILVCGNVGDGKSHILSKLNKDLADEISSFDIHNDATESHSPDETSNDTLRRALDGFSDENLKNSKSKLILAINLGTLSKFLEEHHEDYKLFKEYVFENKILDLEVVKVNKQVNSIYFNHVNFTDYHLYSLTKEGPISIIISKLLELITDKTNKNPFYRALQKSPENTRCPVLYNFEFISHKKNQETIVKLIIQSIVKSKTIVSLRSLFNFIFDIIVPVGLPWQQTDQYLAFINKLDSNQFIDLIIPNYLFEHPELSSLFKSIQKVDPCTHRYSELDKKIIDLASSENPFKIYQESFTESFLIQLKSHITNLEREHLIKFFIRLNYFSKNKELLHLNDPIFNEFMIDLYHYNNHSKSGYKKIYNQVRQAIRKWYGDPRINDKVVLNIGRNQTKYRIFKNFKAKSSKISLTETNDKTIIQFQNELTVHFQSINTEDITVHIDYGLFELIKRIDKGYRPNRKDCNNYYFFLTIIDKIIAENDDEGHLEIDEVNIGNNSDYQLVEDEFGTFKFSML